MTDDREAMGFRKKKAAKTRLKPKGRPRHFAELTVVRCLSLPPAFWAILEELRAEEISYGRALIRAIESDECVRRMRKVFAERRRR